MDIHLFSYENLLVSVYLYMFYDRTHIELRVLFFIREFWYEFVISPDFWSFSNNIIIKQDYEYALHSYDYTSSVYLNLIYDILTNSSGEFGASVLNYQCRNQTTLSMWLNYKHHKMEHVFYWNIHLFLRILIYLFPIYLYFTFRYLWECCMHLERFQERF